MGVRFQKVVRQLPTARSWVNLDQRMKPGDVAVKAPRGCDRILSR
jgi:hypothetical protein